MPGSLFGALRDEDHPAARPIWCLAYVLDEVAGGSRPDPTTKRRFKGYSLGVRQRLGIAVALPSDRRVLILDAAVERGGGALLLTGVDAPTVGDAALRAGVALHEPVAERPDLERVFLELTEGKAAIR